MGLFKQVLILVLLVNIYGCASVKSDLGWSFIKLTTEPITATNVEAGVKEGKACGVNILGILSFGDFSIEKAKYKGNITKVSTIDSEVFSIATIYAKRCTIVKGE